nr:Kazal-type serine protease inhibitor domain-containing protein [Sinorhizobium fredii]
MFAEDFHVASQAIDLAAIRFGLDGDRVSLRLHGRRRRTTSWPAPIRPPQMCTMEFAPVCGERGNRLRTFPNACNARADGFRVLHRGECRPNVRPPVEQACTREYAPVCGERGRLRRTFPNACEAGAAGFRIVRRGECV